MTTAGNPFFTSKKQRNIIIVALISVFLLLGTAGFFFYRIFFAGNVQLANKETDYLYISTHSSFNNVTTILKEKGVIKNMRLFVWVAKQKGYLSKVKPGKYKIFNGMSTNSLVNLLRSGKQEPVRVIFNSIRTKADMASRISKQIEADSTSLIQQLNNAGLAKKFGLTTENILVLFIPNTYEFWWNTNAAAFIGKMYRYYADFWNEERRNQAAAIGLQPAEVSILASIVEKETNKDDEKPMIAGVYLNRLARGWHLEADPTLVFAANDYTIHRVLNCHKNIDSPYNTYKYPGLPPGPICIPSIASIQSVLHFTRHQYLFFCAKEDMTGYHNFAANITQHRVNAVRYQQELDKRKIKK